MKLSIILPTYNRPDKLRNCLDSLAAQTASPHLFEVVIADDGSPDAQQKSLLERVSVDYGPRFRLLQLPHKGPAAARNAGIHHASGEIVLFLGDDIMAAPDLVETHLRIHEARPEPSAAVLGRVRWIDEEHCSLLMRWLECGWQFDYKNLQDGQETDFWRFYTANISLKRAFLLDHGLFNETFPTAAWEDLELGYRLTGHGLRLFYHAEALAFHDHHISFRQSILRSIMVGKTYRIFVGMHPEIPLLMRQVEYLPLSRRIRKARLFFTSRQIPLNDKLARIAGFFFFSPVFRLARKLGSALSASGGTE